MITLIGHPFAPIGLGAQLRSHLRAARAVGLVPRVLDIFRAALRDDREMLHLLGDAETSRTGPGIRIFHVNGDEIPRVLDVMGDDFSAGRNVIVPAWELPHYPAIWARDLKRFDAVWAVSGCMRDSLAAAGSAAPVVGQAVEPPSGPLLGRRAFGIRESAFVLLHMLDLTSFEQRKNPTGAIALFNRLRAADPYADIQLVLKVKHNDQPVPDWAGRFTDDRQIRVLSAPLDSLATRSLINAADCLVSLHRAEGFGRSMAEAMAMGRLAMGTGWSGNLDFMTPHNSLLVDHHLVPVPDGAYPQSCGQNWAEPDLDHAAALLRPILSDPARGRLRGRRGQCDILRTNSNRAVGLRMRDQIDQLARGD